MVIAYRTVNKWLLLTGQLINGYCFYTFTCGSKRGVGGGGGGGHLREHLNSSLRVFKCA